MLEFEPFNPFQTYNYDSNSQSQMSESSKEESQESSYRLIRDFQSNESQDIRTKYIKINENSSEQHNMVKQMIITMKHMMQNHIDNVGSCSFIRKIIKKTWKIFTNLKNPNKEILKAMFNAKLDLKLLKKFNLLTIAEEYGQSHYKQAMNQLREQISLVMKCQSIKSHLLDRRIKKKDRLTAYILYFIDEQLYKRQICYRFGSFAAQKIESILKKIQKEENFIDEFLQNSSEVSLRLTSQINGL